MAVAGGADSAGRRCRCHGYLQLCLESEVIHVIWPSTPPLPQHGLVHAHHGHGGGELLSGRAKESGLLRTTLNNTLRARAMAENSQARTLGGTPRSDTHPQHPTPQLRELSAQDNSEEISGTALQHTSSAVGARQDSHSSPRLPPPPPFR